MSSVFRSIPDRGREQGGCSAPFCYCCISLLYLTISQSNMTNARISDAELAKINAVSTMESNGIAELKSGSLRRSGSMASTPEWVSELLSGLPKASLTEIRLQDGGRCQRVSRVMSGVADIQSPSRFGQCLGAFKTPPLACVPKLTIPVPIVQRNCPAHPAGRVGPRWSGPRSQRQKGSRPGL